MATKAKAAVATTSQKVKTEIESGNINCQIELGSFFSRFSFSDFCSVVVCCSAFALDCFDE